LVEQFSDPGECIMVMQANDALFNAHLAKPAGGTTSLRWRRGSLLALTGVCQSVMGSPEQGQWKWSPSTFRLLLRSPADVAMIKAPPWWTSPPALWAAIAALTVLLTTLGLLSVRSRLKLREQRAERAAAEAEFVAILKERNRLSREMHDTLAQGFTAISAQLEMVKEKLTSAPAVATDHLRTARQLACQSLAEARRSIWGLRPQILETHDLPAALREVGGQLTANGQIAFSLDVTGVPRRLEPHVENDVLRIGQEAITNAVRHAQPSRICLELKFQPDWLRLEVRDDGRGFDLSRLVAPSGEGGFGLAGIRERAAQINAELEVITQPGAGTRIVLCVPSV
jgi:signal transduction histidine kinase